MNAGNWLALAAILLPVLLTAGGMIYRLGQLVNVVKELGRRVERNEDRLARIERRLANGRRALRTCSLVTVCHW
jgi:hypothetical protein